MDGINILFALENEFDITIPDEQAKQIRSIREMVEGIEKLLPGHYLVAEKGRTEIHEYWDVPFGQPEKHCACRTR